MDTVEIFSTVTIGAVWLFHGFYGKILNRIPRHRLIVGRILGKELAGPATKVIGILEILLGLWILTGWERFACATGQTLAIISMNTLEILLAADLLVSALGMVVLNLGFISLIWYWALRTPNSW